MDSFYKEDTHKVNKQMKKMFNSYQEKATFLQNNGNSIAGNGVVEEELSCTAYGNEKRQCWF